jgi:hypothetical protein
MDIEHLKRHVLAGGGQWVGVQECVPPMSALVLFNSPTTQSTLAIHANQLTSETVHAKIVASDAAFGKSKNITVPRATLQVFVADLKEAVASIESLLGRKE